MVTNLTQMIECYHLSYKVTVPQNSKVILFNNQIQQINFSRYENLALSTKQKHYIKAQCYIAAASK